jgi:hypothetical protein
MVQTEQVTVVRGPRELYERTAHLFEVTTISLDCAAKDLVTWNNARHDAVRPGVALRKLYRPSALLDPSLSQHLHTMVERGAGVRISDEEINETIILDRRVVILAGDASYGVRGYSIITVPEVVHGVLSLFDAAWRAATDFAVYDRDAAELRRLAHRFSTTSTPAPPTRPPPAPWACPCAPTAAASPSSCPPSVRRPVSRRAPARRNSA